MLRLLRAAFLAPLAFAAALSLVPARPVAAATDVPPAKTTSLGEIRKEHGVPGPEGKSSVRLVAPADVLDLQGSTVACVLFFTDASGAALSSPMPGYNDRSGALRAVSPDTKVLTATDGLDFSFRIPYAAFPRKPSGKYEVIVRARLVLRGANGPTLLAESHTTFWVEA